MIKLKFRHIFCSLLSFARESSLTNTSFCCWYFCCGRRSHFCALTLLMSLNYKTQFNSEFFITVIIRWITFYGICTRFASTRSAIMVCNSINNHGRCAVQRFSFLRVSCTLHGHWIWAIVRFSHIIYSEWFLYSHERTMNVRAMPCIRVSMCLCVCVFVRTCCSAEPFQTSVAIIPRLHTCIWLNLPWIGACLLPLEFSGRSFCARYSNYMCTYTPANVQFSGSFVPTTLFFKHTKKDSSFQRKLS